MTDRLLVRTTALTAAVVMALAGCSASADEPDPGEPAMTVSPTTASAAPSPAPPAPTAEDATALLVGPTSFSLEDASGTDIGTFDYRDLTGVVDVLTTAFGSDPTETLDDAGRPTLTSWPGFAVQDSLLFDAGDPEPELPEPDFRLFVTAAAVGEVAISTLGGVRIGDDMAAVAAEFPDAVRPGAPDLVGSFAFDVTPVGDPPKNLTTFVLAFRNPASTTVDALTAPGHNWP